MRPKLTVEQFWAKGVRQGQCLIWTGSLSPKGYGKVHWGGRPRRVHRVAWELTNRRPVPTDRVICHNCPDGDNPACFEPTHLWLGTVAENNADKSVKGRAATGQRHSSAKLTPEQVITIRARVATGEVRRIIAADYGVSKSLIDRIANGLNWRHLL